MKVSFVVLYTVMTVSAAVLSFGAAPSRQSRDRPPVVAARQLDFWIGEWECMGRARKGPASEEWQETRATNTVRRILDGKVIQEEFRDAAPGCFKGMSVSVYDAQSTRWRQTWVDSTGSYLEFTGGMEDGRMVLSRCAAPDRPAVQQRMVFSNITRNRFDWDWQRSTDAGKTWRTLWHIDYRRKK